MSSSPPTAAETPRRVSPRSFIVLAAILAAVVLVTVTLVAVLVARPTAQAGPPRPGALGATSEPGSGIPVESIDAGSPEKADDPVAAPADKAPLDQLSADEVAYARYLVGQDASYRRTTDVTGGAGAQYLSADLADASAYGDEVRRMSVLYYDYKAEKVMQYVVDMDAAEIEEVTTAKGVQPAPTELETDVAYDLLLAETDAVADEYSEITGETLTGSSEVAVSAHSWTGGPATDAAPECATDRCVQVLVQTTDGPYLTTTPYVVNLSDQTVTPVQ